MSFQSFDSSQTLTLILTLTLTWSVFHRSWCFKKTRKKHIRTFGHGWERTFRICHEPYREVWLLFCFYFELAVANFSCEKTWTWKNLNLPHRRPNSNPNLPHRRLPDENCPHFEFEVSDVNPDLDPDPDPNLDPEPVSLSPIIHLHQHHSRKQNWKSRTLNIVVTITSNRRCTMQWYRRHQTCTAI